MVNNKSIDTLTTFFVLSTSHSHTNGLKIVFILDFGLFLYSIPKSLQIGVCFETKKNHSTEWLWFELLFWHCINDDLRAVSEALNEAFTLCAESYRWMFYDSQHINYLSQKFNWFRFILYGMMLFCIANKSGVIFWVR